MKNMESIAETTHSNNLIVFHVGSVENLTDRTFLSSNTKNQKIQKKTSNFTFKNHTFEETYLICKTHYYENKSITTSNNDTLKFCFLYKIPEAIYLNDLVLNLWTHVHRDRNLILRE